MDEATKYDRIERYLTDTLTASERTAFEAALAQNPDLQAELDLHREVSETLQGDAIHDFRTALNEVDQEWQEPETQDSGKVFKLPFRRLAAIAASILLAVSAWIYFNADVSNEQLFASNFEPYKMVLNQRSMIPNPETEYLKVDLTKAVSAYESKNFEQAAQLFLALDPASPESDLYQLYGGISKLANQETSAAIRVFERLHQNASPLIIEQCRWYLSMAYLQKGNTESVKNILQQIPDGSFKSKEAKALLSKLN